MRTYEVYIQDNRYRVPTLRLLEAIDPVAARTTAESFMRESTHHLGVEVCQRGVRVFAMGSYRRRAQSVGSGSDA
jgi:hypothetical protein